LLDERAPLSLPALVFPAIRHHAGGEERGHDAIGLEVALVAHPVQLRRRREAAERAAEIELIVVDVAEARIADVAVERVVLDDVDVVDPGGEDAEAAQIAAVLVQMAIVGIGLVAALPEERAEDLALDPAAGERAIAALVVARAVPQDRVEIAG